MQPRQQHTNKQTTTASRKEGSSYVVATNHQNRKPNQNYKNSSIQEAIQYMNKILKTLENANTNRMDAKIKSKLPRITMP